MKKPAKERPVFFIICERTGFIEGPVRGLEPLHLGPEPY